MKTQIKFENNKYVSYNYDDSNNQFVPIGTPSNLLTQEIEQIREYSITPTTFQSRSFADQSLATKISETIPKVAAEKADLENRYNDFKNYHVESQRLLKELSKGVIPEGEFTKIDKDISNLSEKFIPKITALANYEAELEQYIQFIEQNPDLNLSYCDLYCNNASQVIRFGINTAMMNTDHNRQLSSIYTFTEKKESIKSGTKSSKSQKDAEISKVLHPLEVFLIQDAIDFLKESNNKSVLVDIFVREDDGSITIKDNTLDIHTVVLYFNRDIGKIIVIDPSNPEFSRHIASNSFRLFRSAEDNVEITIPRIEKIYVPFDKNNVGSKADQYRDCIDLSVKIAFGLNKLSSYINTEYIRNSDVIKEVTNQEQNHESLFFSPDQAVARIRQASDDDIRSQAQKLLFSFDKLIKATDNYSPSKALEIQQNSIIQFSLLYQSNQYEECISGLSNCYRESMDLFKGEIESEVSNLLGEINQEL